MPEAETIQIQNEKDEKIGKEIDVDNDAAAKNELRAIDSARDRFDHKNKENSTFRADFGLTKELVEMISRDKNEPEWMLQHRLKCLELFHKLPWPSWGPSLKDLDMSKISFYLKPDAKQNARDWKDVPDDIKKTFERLGIPEAERKSLGGVGAQYECLSADSLIWTNPKGHTKIKDIKSGNMVFSLDEKSNQIKKAKVVAVRCSGKKKIFEIHAGTRSIKASDNHPFLVLEHRKKPEKRRGRYYKVWKPLNELKKGELIAIAVSIPDCGEPFNFIQPTYKTHASSTNQFGVKHDYKINYNKVSLPKKSDNDILWFFGIFLGDGYIKKEKGREKMRVNIAIPQIQEDLRNELKKVIVNLFGEGLISEYEYYISINSSIVAKFLEANGFSGNAHTKSIPSWIFSIPREQKLAFLGGYLDSDGNVRKNEGDVSFTSANKKLLEAVAQLVDYCNLHSSNIHKFESIHPFDRTRKITGYRMQLSGDVTQLGSRYSFKRDRLSKHKFHRTYQTAKGTVFRKHCSDYLGFAKIDSIDELGIEPVYDIEVEGYHNFISNGFIVHNSMVVYHNLKKELSDQGVIFEDCDYALKHYPELMKKYFMKCVPASLHKFAALHGAVWSGGTFLYIPKGVKVELPLQAYFRMNAESLGQFEHTLIIVEEGAQIHYIEGCSAPRYDSSSLHAGCVEVFVHKNARARYSSIENWSRNTFNLNTKRANVYNNAYMEWVNGNLGCLTENSKVFTNPKGPVSIKDINEGAKVFVWDEKTNSIKSSVVKKKIFSGIKKVYRLEAGGREIEASLNHPFLTLARIKNKPEHKNAFFKFAWKPLEELKKGEVVGIVKRLPIEGKPHKLPAANYNHTVASKNQYSDFKMSVKHLYNEKIIIPEETNDDFMWLMGILIGDGHIDAKNNKINVAIHEKDDRRDELIAIVKRLFNYEITYKKDRYVIINSRALCQLFAEIGFSGTADTKTVPDWVFSLPKEQILAFIAGYFDSDGHVEKGGVYITSINKELLQKIKLLAIAVGFGVSRIFVHGKARKTRILGVECNAKDSWRLLLNGHAVHRLPTKSEKRREILKQSTTRRNFSRAANLNFKSKTNEDIGFATIDNIEYLGEKPTYDLEIADYHNFISNGLVVHNSNATMLYPCSVLMEEGAKTDYLGVAFAGKGQNQDTGCKVYHLAKNTNSTIKAKSISKDGGITTYRGLLMVAKGATGSKAKVVCDALMLDNISKSDTVPTTQIHENRVDIGHEATVGKIDPEQIFYLMSRGISEEQATQMVVAGFIEPIVKELPLEYAVELNRLIQLEMEGMG